MAEYIEREAALAALCSGCDKMVPSDEREPCRYRFTGCMEYYNIFAFPAADVAPVVHGHWVEKELFIPWCDDDVDIIYECSCCRTESGGTSPYCPNCGAKMDGGADNA